MPNDCYSLPRTLVLGWVRMDSVSLGLARNGVRRVRGYQLTAVRGEWDGPFPPRQPKNKCGKCASVTSSITTGVFCTFTSVYASVYMCTQACTLRVTG